MARHRRTDTIEIEVSLRMHDVAGPCAYVVALRVLDDGARQLIDSRHVTGDPLVICDTVFELVREHTLEQFLPLTSPF